MDSYEKAVATEMAEGFDRSKAEDALQEFLCARLHGGAAMFESNTVGVIAMERLDWRDEQKIDWDELSAALEKATGVSVACIDDTDWSFDDRCDEEATYFAFAIPSLDRGYADDYRHNKVSAVSPAP